MSHVLRYRYQPGETYTYHQQVSVLMEPPAGEPIADTGVVVCKVTAKKNDDATWAVHLSSRVTEQLKFLTPLDEENADYTITERGQLVNATPSAPAVPFIVFPNEAVDLKETWKTVESSLQRRVAMDHTLTTLEEVEGDTLAHVVTEGTSAGEPAIDYFAVRVFSVKEGHPIVGRTVVKYVYATGQTLSFVVEEQRQGV